MYEIICLGLAMVAPCSKAIKDWVNDSPRVGNIVIVGNFITPQGEILEQVDITPGQRLSRWEMWQAERRLRKHFADSPYFTMGKGPRILIENTKETFRSITIEFPEQRLAGDSK